MNKKLIIVMLLALGLMPSSVFGFTNPLKSYNLYDDVKGGASSNSERETVMSEFYDNSLRAGTGSSNVSLEKEAQNMEKVADLMGKIQQVTQDQSIPTSEKLSKFKKYNDELKNLMKDYKDDPNYASTMSILAENDKMIAALGDNSLTDAEKFQKVLKSRSTQLNTLNKMSSYDLTPASTTPAKGRNAYLRQSSKRTYSSSSKPQWETAMDFYENPSLESIKEKYRKSNFTGCMQEAESYVKKNPTDTLGFYYLAMSYAKSGDKENAIKAYEKVIQLNDNPMIVKYATNGRNCVMSGSETCYQNVNVAEIQYPYRDKAKSMNMTPIDVETLINSKYAEVQKIIIPPEAPVSKDKDGEAQSPVVNLPFGTQDEKLDEFIQAPYGNGFSSEFNQEYRMKQLKQIKDQINKEKNNDFQQEYRNLENIKNFDNKKSELEITIDTTKLAYDNSFDFEQLKNDPEYVKNKREMEELNMLFGGSRESSKKDLMDLIPALTDKENGISPELFQHMMMDSIMPDIIDTKTI